MADRGWGVLLIAILGIGLAEPLLKINAIKNVLATIANAIASVVFIFVSDVNWPAAIAIAVGSVLGAQVGGGSAASCHRRSTG